MSQDKGRVQVKAFGNRLRGLFALLLVSGWFFANLSSLSGFSVAGSVHSSQQVPVGFTHAYLPDSYDDNDPVTFVGELELPDSCTKITSHQAQVSSADRRIEISAIATRSESDCKNVPQLVDLEFELGVLSAGTYSVESSGRVHGIFEVSHAQDQHMDSSSYAPVDDVQLLPTPRGEWKLRMSGFFPDDCFSFDRAKFHHQPDVMTIEPISRLWEFGCGQKTDVPFSASVALPSGSQSGRTLIHVRSAGGVSRNFVFDWDQKKARVVSQNLKRSTEFGFEPVLILGRATNQD